MTDEQPPLDPSAATPAEVPPAPPDAASSGWVQPAAPPAVPAVEGSGWVQPAAPPAAAPGPAWGAPSAPVEGSGWVQPATPPAAAPGPAWGQPPAAAPGPAWGQPAAAAPPVQPPAAASGPAWGAPPAAPPPAAPPAPPTGWAQPQPTAGWVQPSVAAKGPVTILARIAGLGLILVGLVWVGFGLIALIGGAVIQSLVDQIAPGGTDPAAVAAGGKAITSAFTVLGVVWIVLAAIEILGGLGALLGKGFGRAIGIVYSLIFGLVLLPGISALAKATAAGDLSNGDVDVRPFVLVFVAMFVVYVYSLIVLLFRWRGSARA